MSKYQYHKDGTIPENGEIFVFGSNEAGVHGAGAAKAAHSMFGAKMGVGLGFTGRSFGIPTKDYDIKTLPIEKIEVYVKIFLYYANDYRRKYFVTRVGCGLAGFSDSEIAPLFKNAPDNCNFPEEWKPFLECEVDFVALLSGN